jgi:hypothetical protein
MRIPVWGLEMSGRQGWRRLVERVSGTIFPVPTAGRGEEAAEKGGFFGRLGEKDVPQGLKPR